MGGGQQVLKDESSPGEEGGNGIAGRSTNMDVGKGTMAWELQVVAGTEPVA